MLQHTKRQVELFKMHCFTIFTTALCVILFGTCSVFFRYLLL